jgi:hypothetical protein
MNWDDKNKNRKAILELKAVQLEKNITQPDAIIKSLLEAYRQVKGNKKEDANSNQSNVIVVEDLSNVDDGIVISSENNLESFNNPFKTEQEFLDWLNDKRIDDISSAQFTSKDLTETKEGVKFISTGSSFAPKGREITDTKYINSFLNEGDVVKFFAEKWRDGVVKNSQIVDNKGNSWGLIGILSTHGKLINMSLIERIRKTKQKQWIKSQIKNPELKGKPIYTTAENKEHAETINRLINGGDTSNINAEVESDKNKTINNESDQKNQKIFNSGFQGYKGGFENTGKGTPQGDGKDKAMREVADRGGVIVELASLEKSSSLTSFLEIEPFSTPNIGTNAFIGGQDKIIMLARNGELSKKPLKQETKNVILEAHNKNYSFVVGDMPDVDSQFIDYLQEIGATFTIYHTGNEPRIKIQENTNQEPIISQEDIIKNPNIKVVINTVADLMFQLDKPNPIVYDGNNLEILNILKSEGWKQNTNNIWTKNDDNPIEIDTEDDERNRATVAYRNMLESLFSSLSPELQSKIESYLESVSIEVYANDTEFNKRLAEINGGQPSFLTYQGAYYYDTETNQPVLLINGYDKTNDVIIHEFLHGLIQLDESRDEDIINAILEIHNRIAYAIMADEVYKSGVDKEKFKTLAKKYNYLIKQAGSGNNAKIAEEIMVLAMTDKEFGQLLNSINYKGATSEKPKTLFGKIVDAFMSYFNIVPTESSLLTRVMNLSIAYFDQANFIKNQGVRTLPSEKTTYKQIYDDFIARTKNSNNKDLSRRYHINYGEVFKKDSIGFQYTMDTLEEGDLILTPKWTKVNGKFVQDGTIWRPVIHKTNVLFSSIAYTDLNGDKKYARKSDILAVRRRVDIELTQSPLSKEEIIESIESVRKFEFQSDLMRGEVYQLGGLVEGLSRGDVVRIKFNEEESGSGFLGVVVNQVGDGVRIVTANQKELFVESHKIKESFKLRKNWNPLQKWNKDNTIDLTNYIVQTNMNNEGVKQFLSRLPKQPNFVKRTILPLKANDMVLYGVKKPKWLEVVMVSDKGIRLSNGKVITHDDKAIIKYANRAEVNRLSKDVAILTDYLPRTVSNDEFTNKQIRRLKPNDIVIDKEGTRHYVLSVTPYGIIEAVSYRKDRPFTSRLSQDDISLIYLNRESHPYEVNRDKILYEKYQANYRSGEVYVSDKKFESEYSAYRLLTPELVKSVNYNSIYLNESGDVLIGPNNELQFRDGDEIISTRAIMGKSYIKINKTTNSIVRGLDRHYQYSKSTDGLKRGEIVVYSWDKNNISTGVVQAIGKSLIKQADNTFKLVEGVFITQGTKTGETFDKFIPKSTIVSTKRYFDIPRKSNVKTLINVAGTQIESNRFNQFLQNMGITEEEAIASVMKADPELRVAMINQIKYCN